MGAATSKPAWDEASTPAAHSRTRGYESDWRSSAAGRRPDPRTYLQGATPGEKLALLRADLGLRWEGGDRIGVEWYRDRIPDLDGDAWVALIYEEFCLREDFGESPSPSSFLARFPEVAAPLRRVLEIHDLVGSGQGASASFGTSPGASPRVPFPEVGQTIAGFELVEELGRGGFARVFRARERDLADRPVALKVARSGSREPQTLARLQHTHIVPVHSYRTDPATGLHLLCMPYFGRVTLAHLLADEATRDARSGAEIVAALDRLDREESVVSSRPAGRRALAARPYARAIAWWGARLAEALQHAHERGVLHRDIKPSNVLVTGDGMPMLLDFNLAHETLVEEIEASPALGGTVGYMSPEHLEALADGLRDGVDGRSDIYALGVVLYEAMGERPFAAPTPSRSVREVLLRAAEDRRAHPPDLLRAFPETPPALAAVVARCLAPDPSDRYATAGELALDLQAVADDRPLAFAREPIAHRAAGFVRRNRQALAMVGMIVLAVGLSAYFLARDRLNRQEKRHEIAEMLLEADHSSRRDDFELGLKLYAAVERLTANAPELAASHRKARIERKGIEQARAERERAGRFFGQAEGLRLRLLGYEGDRKPMSLQELDPALAPFYVLTSPDWTSRPDLLGLHPKQRTDLIREVTELLFLQAWAGAHSSSPSLQGLAVARCDVALNYETGEARAPWVALKAVAAARRAGQAPPAIEFPEVRSVPSSWRCYQWGRIALLSEPGRRDRVAAWLEQATRRDEAGRFWLELDTAYQEDLASQSDPSPSHYVDRALSHYTAALKLRPDYSRALLNRARLLARRGAWDQAIDDLDRALAIASGEARRRGAPHAPEIDEIQVERGFVLQSVGRLEAARLAYQSVQDSPLAGRLRRASLANLAKLDLDQGRLAEARDDVERLLAADPADLTARLGRALLLLRDQDPEGAEQDLNFLLARKPDDAEALAYRARARLAGNRPEEARRDAERALRLDPTPRHDRLLNRTLLALGRIAEARLDDPEEIRLFPGGSARLAADLRAATQGGDAGYLSPSQRSTRAAMLSALGDPRAATEAARAVRDDPQSLHARLVLVRVLRASGRRLEAIKEVEGALREEPGDPRLHVLHARLRIEAGRSADAVAELDMLERLGGSSLLFGPRADAKMTLGQARSALDDWNRAIAHDPDDPSHCLGRARTFLALGKIDLATADLERAADLAGDRAEILTPLALTYLKLLPRHPEAMPRFRSLLTRVCKAFHASRKTRNAFFQP